MVLRIQACSMHRTLEVKTQPFLNAAHAATLGKIQEENQVQNDRRRQNAVSAQEIDFDLHGITEPSVDIDVIPSFLIISSRRIVMNAYFVREILVKIRIKLRLKDLIKDRQFAFFLGLEGIRIVKNFAVAIS